jgi:hypothetical protein
LGFEGLLGALAAAKALNVQVDAMDLLKERLKKHKADAGGALVAEKLEKGYRLMLRLFVDPRAAVLRKAS